MWIQDFRLRDQALEPEFLLYLSFQVEGDLMDGWITQS
jgi:hypothetical protein